jgi:putative addiction module killer protein
MTSPIRTDEYRDWLKALADARAKARISIRVDRLVAGNPGDVEPVGEGVSEMRIDYGSRISRLLHEAGSRSHNLAVWRR